MLKITIVGGGAYGSLIAEKYKKFINIETRAVISRQKPTSGTLGSLPFCNSASEWKKNFGRPSKSDVFDMCVHQNILVDLMKDLIAIGARNFILPKPIALSKKELEYIQNLVSKYDLKLVVASQWHYSYLVKTIGDFISKNKTKLSRIDINFSKSFEGSRKKYYNAKNAFLPHIIQVLHDLKLNKKEAESYESVANREAIKIKYQGSVPININTDIVGPHKEVLEIFLKSSKTPAFVADFSSERGSNGLVVFPKVIIGGKETQIKEDVLEKMIEKNISYFENPNAKSNVLTLKKYLPVAREIALIAEKSNKIVGIIGGGIFGVMAAIEIAKKGHSVVIFEKEKNIIMGASLVNHGRIHMGYHYPRDKKTVIQSLETKAPFENFFGKSVVKKIDNYYMVAKEGSMTNYKKFLKFCEKMHLPYQISWPKKLKILKEKIAVSIKVPETIFDANRLRGFLLKEISKYDNITLLTGAPVTGLQKSKNGFAVNYKIGDKEKNIQCAALVNATYGEINSINSLLGLPLQTFQYELCELPVAKAPWKGTGWMIMDGPFFSAMPFGFSDKCLFYDVELSVLERVIGKLPNFKFDLSYYDDKKRKAERFKKYKQKWGAWIDGVKDCKHSHSMYAERVVLPAAEKTDKRPTIIKNPIPGFWQVFSGKITASVPRSAEVSNEIDKFLKK